MTLQLEFNIGQNSNNDLSEIKTEIKSLNESAHKVRKKLFKEVNELKKALLILTENNKELQNIVDQLKGIKTEWQYIKNDNLFDLVEYQEAMS